jgi:hypothetical protein
LREKKSIPDWPQTYDPPAQPPKCCDYRCVPPYLDCKDGLNEHINKDRYKYVNRIKV